MTPWLYQYLGFSQKTARLKMSYVQEQIILILQRKRQLKKLFPTQSRLLTALKKEPFENTMGKGENAGNFPTFPTLPKTNNNFSITYTLPFVNTFTLNQFKILSFGKGLTLSQTNPGFYVSAVQVFRKHCGKRRNCSLRAISPFPTVFSTLLENFLPFSSNLKLSSANSFSLEESKICRLVKG